MNQFAKMIIDISEKRLTIHNIDGDEFLSKYGHKCPVGVNGRNSDNNLYREKIGWSVDRPLSEGLLKTYRWIQEQIEGV